MYKYIFIILIKREIRYMKLLDIQRNAILDLESSLDNATFIKEFNRQQRATDENGNPLLF